MSESDFLHLDAQLGEAGSCGPDLDTAGDDDHLNFLARVEGVLPASFAAFDRSQIDFSGEMKAASALLDRAIDLRVLVLLAKLTILDRRLTDFAGVVAAMAAVLKQHWDGVHPSGDIELRRGVLMALDDMPHTVMPLQAVPLFESRNLGRVSFRHYLIASGAIAPRDNEESHQAVTIATALERADDGEIEASRAALARLATGLSDMAAVFSQHLGAGHDLALPNLRKLVTDQRAWLDKEWVRRNPAQAGAVAAASGGGEPHAPGAAAPVAGTVASHEDARQALDAVAAYFARHEPSSLALLLVRQCRQLSHVSFLEAMRTLVPDAMPLANLRIGKGIGFTIPIERFSAFETAGPEEDELAATVTDMEQETDEPSEPEDDADTVRSQMMMPRARRQKKSAMRRQMRSCDGR